MAGDDWLSKAASVVSTIGSFVDPVATYLTNSFDPKTNSLNFNQGNTKLLEDTRSTLGAAATAGGFVGAAVDDVAKSVTTGPTLWAMHGLGIGKQGDEWDKGPVGRTGDRVQ